MNKLRHSASVDKSLVNKFNPKKLLNSKWTALNPQNKELHFIVVKLIESEEDESKIEGCLLQSVMHKTDYDIACSDLKGSSAWQQGWK
ncbi:MAG: TIGR02450 family Trp-rich protein [Pseudomonadota bacterium]|nr:TIGR02450 family Trp-rich protein [Pseudomonadota bacterium]